MISPSRIALNAAGFDPIAEYQLKDESRCVMCGISMQLGDQAAAWAPTDSFTNWMHLLAPESKHVCPHCNGAWRIEFTQGWATGALYNEEGVHKVNSADSMAHALLNPPKTPFLWVRGDQKQQHLVWRTPITVDPNLLRVRLGEKVVSIRRQIVLDALNDFRAAEEVLKTLPKDQRPAKKANPGNESGIYKYLDWSIDNVDHALLSDALLALAAGKEEHSNQFAELARVLQALNFGEVWALMILLKSKTPTAPTIVATPKSI
jgi:CRISPR type IV-associated protein Csf1